MSTQPFPQNEQPASKTLREQQAELGDEILQILGIERRELDVFQYDQVRSDRALHRHAERGEVIVCASQKSRRKVLDTADIVREAI